MRSVRLAMLLSLPLWLAGPAPAQNCGNTSVGFVPLTELTGGSYQGFAGGLYPGGQNVPPAAHDAAGRAEAQAVQPLDAQGNPDPQGRIVLVSIGMSNATQEFSAFVPISNADPNRSGAVVVVDGAQGGQDARTVANPAANYWNVVDQRLAAAGVTPQQVQAAWIKEAVARPTLPFPQHALELRDLYAQIARNLRARYPNLRLAFYSSRIYAGYATTMLNPEPFAYESAFSVQWLIEQQSGGDPTLNFDPARGAVQAPWIGWGPYLWADGLQPRSDGLIWECADFAADGTHPGPSGRAKVAAMLQAHFSTSPYTTPWYLGPGGGGGTTAAFLHYGRGCPGSAGVPEIVGNGLPSLGNSAFRVGVRRAAASRPAALFVGLAAGQAPLASGCDLLLDPAVLLASFFVTTDGQGRAILPLPVPGDPALAGLELFGQWLVDDPGGTPLPPLLGLAASGGAQMRVGTP